ncbi:M23 family metallopeptidase [Marinicellulosiphila megalodicopiae]|uniref:M23 family metallopeptidase n=1 Tax=Marinicellulosiphila megalodicopiae TaxID=2724896 RepID=UPI003BAFBE4F
MKGISLYFTLILALILTLFLTLTGCASGFKSIDEKISEDTQDLKEISQAKPFSFFPVTGQISSHFGYRTDPHNKQKKLHKGLDITVPVGTKVISAASGQIMFAGKQSGYGLVVEILHDNQMTTRYAHLSKILVKQPQTIVQGQLIGLSGQTGNATGPHVHYELLYKGEQIDPFVFTKDGKIVEAN